MRQTILEDEQQSPREGFMRLGEIVGPRGRIPISRSAWYAGIKRGKFPKPVKLGPRTSAWRRSEIEALVARLAAPSA